jgi:hypothetical protein
LSHLGRITNHVGVARKILDREYLHEHGSSYEGINRYYDTCTARHIPYTIVL